MPRIEAVDATVQKTESWVRDLMLSLGWNDPDRAFTALRATLHALRDRLPVQEAAHLGAQLPMLVRGVYYEGWDPDVTPVRERHRSQFLRHIDDAFRNDPRIDSEAVARAVFHLLRRKVSAGEIRDVEGVLPQEVRELWS